MNDQLNPSRWKRFLPVLFVTLFPAPAFSMEPMSAVEAAAAAGLRGDSSSSTTYCGLCLETLTGACDSGAGEPEGCPVKNGSPPGYNAPGTWCDALYYVQISGPKLEDSCVGSPNEFDVCTTSPIKGCRRWKEFQCETKIHWVELPPLFIRVYDFSVCLGTTGQRPTGKFIDAGTWEKGTSVSNLCED